MRQQFVTGLLKASTSTGNVIEPVPLLVLEKVSRELFYYPHPCQGKWWWIPGKE